ncbi:MAG: Tad domain-containing protein [Pseudomonadota bacterium]
MSDLGIETGTATKRFETKRALGRSTAWSALFKSRARAFRDGEEGSFIIFSLFLLILMILLGGMAVDLMRFETRRTALQNTLDAAALASTNIKQDLDAETLAKDFMEKAGYNPDLVKVDPVETYVGQDDAGNGGTLVARSVTVDYDLKMNTFFMDMLGINVLRTNSAGEAFERVQNVEISLVVDISGSMGGQKMTDLKSSAKNFFNSVIDEDAVAEAVATDDVNGLTTVSIIPYNHAVVVPDSLLWYLPNSKGDVSIPPAAQAEYDGALTSYPRVSLESACIRFYDDQMITSDLAADYLTLRAIKPSETLDRMAYYDMDHKSAGPGDRYDRPADDYNRRCDPTRGSILAWETDIGELEDHIDSLYASGWTAVDVGLKWASALLDPEFGPIVDQMITDDRLPGIVRDRPGEYDPANVMKVIVMMTDGTNTNQYDMGDDYKNGPSRIWFSEKASRDTGPEGEDWRNFMIVDTNENGSRDREKRWYDGYFVEMPNNSESERWLRPHSIGNRTDGVLYDEDDLPDDARQLHYVELYDRFSERAVSFMFRDDDVGDETAYNAHRNAERTVVNGNSADQRMLGRGTTGSAGICDAIKYNDDVLIFSIAFQAPSNAERVMRECATADGYYFDAENGEELAEAFAAIAGAITKLRLTQ